MEDSLLFEALKILLFLLVSFCETRYAESSKTMVGNRIMRKCTTWREQQKHTRRVGACVVAIARKERRRREEPFAVQSSGTHHSSITPGTRVLIFSY